MKTIVREAKGRESFRRRVVSSVRCSERLSQLRLETGSLVLTIDAMDNLLPGNFSGEAGAEVIVQWVEK